MCIESLYSLPSESSSDSPSERLGSPAAFPSLLTVGGASLPLLVSREPSCLSFGEFGVCGAPFHHRTKENKKEKLGDRKKNEKQYGACDKKVELKI